MMASSSGAPIPPLPWSRVYAADELCDRRLPMNVVKTHQVLVVRRGGCSFGRKLANIPSYSPSSSSNALQLVIVVSYGHDDSSRVDEDADADADVDDDDEDSLIRPYLDQQQTTPAGLPRHHPIPMVLVAGGQRVYDALKDRTVGVGIKRRYHVETKGVRIANLVIV
jgi:hypothetical protein